MLGRINVQPDNVGSLGFEIGIGRSHVSLNPVGLQSSASPYSRYHHVIDAELCSKLSTAPMRGSVRWFSTSPIEDTSLEAWCLCLDSPAMIMRVQTRQSVLQKPLLPAADIAWIAVKRAADGRIRFTVSKHQNQPRAPRIFGPKRSRTNTSLEFFLNRRFQRYICKCGHEYIILQPTSRVNVTVH